MTRARSPLSLCLCLVSLALACGCSRTARDGEKAAVLEKRIEAALKTRQEMEDRGAAKLSSGDLEVASKKIEEAKRLLAQGKLEAAYSKLAAAERTLKDLGERMEAAEKSRAAALEARRAAEGALAGARQARANEEAADLFEEARKAGEAARADLESGNPLRLERARAGYERVQALAAAARTAAEERGRQRQAMEAHRKAALAAEAEARAARAETLAAEEMVRARQSLRDADLDRERGRLSEAESGYRDAEVAFASALARARAGTEATASAPSPGSVEDGPAGQRRDPAPVPEPKDPPRVSDAGGSPATAEAPDGLSSEDEVFLAQNFRKLTSRVEPGYDPSTGEFTVEYDFGESMVKDLLFPHGPIPEKHIGYRDPLNRIAEKDAGGKKELGIAFSGNTRGFFLFPFPFKGSVTIEYALELGMISPGGSLSVILMSSPDGKNFFAADFGTVEVWSQGKMARAQLPRDPAFRKNPNTWFKKDRVGMRIAYGMRPAGPTGSPRRAQVSIGYDTGDVLHGEEPINVAAVPERTGLVGFSWSGTKFNVKMLRIRGLLDRPAAVKLLRERLGKSPPRIVGEPVRSAPESAASPVPSGALAWARGPRTPQYSTP
jgi:hypothetical protein